jgi:rsbT co-antagonist protein RsbR
MRCDACILESEGNSTPLHSFLEQLTQCTECPLVVGEGASPAVRLLVGRLHEAARALRKLANSARKSEHELAELQADVGKFESRVVLAEALRREASEKIAEELKEKVELLERKEQAIRALSTPIIDIWDGVLVLPLIGTLNAARTATLMENLLIKVISSNASHAILDLTGVDEIDAQTVEHLLKISLAVKLLGAEVLLTGLPPRVAQAMVALGVDLSGIRTLRTVKEALRRVLSSPEAPALLSSMNAPPPQTEARAQRG